MKRAVPGWPKHTGMVSVAMQVGNQLLGRTKTAMYRWLADSQGGLEGLKLKLIDMHFTVQYQTLSPDRMLHAFNGSKSWCQKRLRPSRNPGAEQRRDGTCVTTSSPESCQTKMLLSLLCCERWQRVELMVVPNSEDFMGFLNISLNTWTSTLATMTMIFSWFTQNVA